MSKGTILYIGGFELPDKNAAAHRVLSNGKIFRELGYNVVFIDVDKCLDFDSEIINSFKIVQGFDCWSLPYPKASFEWFQYLSSIKYIDFISDKYKDIKYVVAYNYPAMALFNLKKYCNLNNIKIIADCTEWYSTRGSNIFFKIIKGTDSFIRMRILQKQLDGLIVISKYLENYYENCKNVIRVPPLIDINEDKWRNNLLQNDTKQIKAWKFVYSGSPGKNKDKTDCIVDAFYKLRDHTNYKLEIVGINKLEFLDNYPEYHKKIKAMNGRVEFLGRVSHINSLKKIMDADYSIFIRDKSRVNMAGFPTKFVESITCFTSVITSDSSDIREYFTNSSYGFLLDNDSTNRLVAVLEKIIESNNKESTKKNLDINIEMFHYQRYKELFEGLIQKII